MMESLVVMGTGLVIVFGVLILLVLLITLFGVAFRKKDKPAAPAAPVVEKPLMQEVSPLQAPVAEGAIPAEVIAAISAAVYTMYGQKGPVRIQSIRRSSGARKAWAAAGIMENTQPF